MLASRNGEIRYDYRVNYLLGTSRGHDAKPALAFCELGKLLGSPQSIVRISQQVVERAASAGNCVIVGRGSRHFLRNREDTARFFLYASKHEKVQRLVAGGNSEADAEHLVDTVDHERAAFIKEYFHAEWPDRSIYHAMFNTDTGEEAVLDAILNFLRQRESKSFPPRSGCA